MLKATDLYKNRDKITNVKIVSSKFEVELLKGNKVIVDFFDGLLINQQLEMFCYYFEDRFLKDSPAKILTKEFRAKNKKETGNDWNF